MLPTMILYFPLSSAILFISPYFPFSKFVHFIILSIHVNLGLCLFFFSSTLPSRIRKCPSPLEPLNTCPAYFAFLFITSFRKYKSVLPFSLIDFFTRFKHPHSLP